MEPPDNDRRKRAKQFGGAIGAGMGVALVASEHLLSEYAMYIRVIACSIVTVLVITLTYAIMGRLLIGSKSLSRPRRNRNESLAAFLRETAARE